MLEQKLNSKLVELYFKLDNELTYVDRKEQVPEMRLRKHIDRIEGFLLGCAYIKSVYHERNNIETKYVPSGNSILDNIKEYEGD